MRMVSTGSPPVPLPVQVPPGHVLQQIVDERGTLRHVILSPAPTASSTPVSSSNGAPSSTARGVLPLATPPHPPPPPSHYVSIDWQLSLSKSLSLSFSFFLSFSLSVLADFYFHFFSFLSFSSPFLFDIIFDSLNRQHPTEPFIC